MHDLQAKGLGKQAEIRRHHIKNGLERIHLVSISSRYGYALDPELSTFSGMSGDGLAIVASDGDFHFIPLYLSATEETERARNS
jgi:hypothetical protein